MKINTDKINGVHSVSVNMMRREDWYKDVTVEDMDCLGLVFDDKKDAVTFASHFPKYCKVKLNDISSCREGWTKPYVQIDVFVSTDERTGEFNETAQKRRDKILSILTDLEVF